MEFLNVAIELQNLWFRHQLSLQVLSFYRAPKGWAGAGVGIGMLRVGGDSFNLKSTQSFKVSKFQSFNVTMSQSSNDSKFQKFRVSKHHLIVFEDMDPISPNSHSMFLGDIDPIFKIINKY